MTETLTYILMANGSYKQNCTLCLEIHKNVCLKIFVACFNGYNDMISSNKGPKMHITIIGGIFSNIFMH